MSLLLNTQSKNAAPFYNGAISTSLRLSAASSQFLSQTLGTTNRRTFTFSVWVKRTGVGTVQNIFSGGDNSSNNDYWFGFTAADILQFQNITGSAYNAQVTTVRKFRDTSAWYNFVLSVDSTIEDSGTVIDRVRLYVNGVREPLTIGHQLQNDELLSVNLSGSHKIGILSYATSQYLDAYIADANFVDGTSLEPAAFGQLKNGVWIPIDPSPTYGTNGYRLKFTSRAHDAPASNGSADTDNIGADSSGENNHFTAADAIVTSDCAIADNPENNFCVLGSSAMRRYGHTSVSTMTEGNLKAATGGNFSHNFGTMSINQILANDFGVYFEVRLVAIDNVRTYFGLVAGDAANNKCGGANAGGQDYPIKAMMDRRGYWLTGTNDSSTNYTSVFTANANDVVGIMINKDGKMFMHLNGTYFDLAGGTQNPANGANPLTTLDLTKEWFPYMGYASTLHANFGQDGSFSGTETSGGETDSEGRGDFFAEVPSGYVCLSTVSMADTTIGANSSTQGNDHFNTVIFTGDDNANRAVTGVGFKPDWLWHKARNVDGNYHFLFDSNRGVDKRLSSNVTDVEGDATGLDSFDVDGFTVDHEASNQDMNASAHTYVAWNWKANGGTATATISESGDNPAASVQANPTAGFSIITYTGTGDAGTIAHGLGVVPTMMIIKNRDVNDAWAIYQGANTTAPATDYLVLNTTAATVDAATYWADTAPTSSVFTVHDAHNVNADGEKYVAYVFADVEGYSKMGTYVGNGSVDGPHVYLGFRPAWIMSKKTSGTGNWEMFDTVRDTSNTTGKYILANSSDQEGDTGTNTAGHVFDILSNGFKIRNTNADRNTGGAQYIYMAFAEESFKYSNAR